MLKYHKLAWHAGISYETVRVIVIGGSFSQRYVFGETMLDSGKNRTNKGYMRIITKNYYVGK